MTISWMNDILYCIGTLLMGRSMFSHMWKYICSRAGDFHRKLEWILNALVSRTSCTMSWDFELGSGWHGIANPEGPSFCQNSMCT